MPGAAGGADNARDVQDKVLGGDAGAEIAFDAHFHGLPCAQQQRLRRKHVLDLARADAERERAQRAVRGGVAVAADQRGAGEGEALLGPDDVDDALLAAGRVEVAHAERGRVALERGELVAALGVGDRHAIPSASSRGVVGRLWSGTASVSSGWRTLRPFIRSDSNACGLVTSWTRWRSMKIRQVPSSRRSITCSSQIFS